MIFLPVEEQSIFGSYNDGFVKNTDSFTFESTEKSEVIEEDDLNLRAPCFTTFPTAFLLSVFFGFLGADRFYMGHVAMGVAKLSSFGGFGIWWILDIILLAYGNLTPVGLDC
ncbi:putative TM2 domain [Monocercomonoides exilis]|uniref:putative TM2 domain n=1 Tax=Monocercomonoides exilis TaxID=2049356 RepID=UPI0035594260|nr:putative TM2 domain [Monocercomonoides exilis]